MGPGPLPVHHGQHAAENIQRQGGASLWTGSGGRRRRNTSSRELEVVTPSTETPVRRLSGGNVQKVLLGREIKAGPNVIVTAYPVRGLDINSSYAIYHILNEQKKSGVGILFVGEDLDVMMALCDKIMVLWPRQSDGA